MEAKPPHYVYKIVPSSPPEPLPADFPLSELDSNDGFVHLSTSTQVPATADLFFTNVAALWIVKLRFADFVDNIKWEGGFPHLYGNFGKDNVDSVEKFIRNEDKNWTEVMRESTWLE